MVYKSLMRPQSFLGKLRTSCKVIFFYLQFGSKYDCLRHAHIIMRFGIWFELSDRGATPPQVPRKVTQNTRPSFSHVRARGSGHETNSTWLTLGTGLYFGFKGLHPGSPTTQSFLPSFSSLQCLGYMYRAQFPSTVSLLVQVLNCLAV